MNFKNFTLLALSILFFTFPDSLQAQIPTEGLIGYYTMDGHAADSSGMMHDGTFVGAPVGTEDRFGVENGALLFNTASDYIDLGSPAAFQNTTSISISVWAKQILEPNSFRALVNKWAGFGANGWYLGINNANNAPRWNPDSPEFIEGNPLTNDMWTHIVATYDGDSDSLKIYQDGVLINSSFDPDFNANNSANVVIAQQSDGAQGHFNGAIDEVLLYDRALTAFEIAVLNNPSVSTFEVSQYANKLSVYPNPSNGFVNIDNQTGFNNLPYTLYSGDGSRIKSGIHSGSTIDLNDLPRGFYYLKMNVDDEFVTKKIILTK